MTDGGQWARLEALFDAAVDVPLAERDAWIAARCGDDPSLAAQLARMLAAHDRPGPLDRAAVTPRLPEADVRQRLAAALAEQYDLEERLGAGGMSVVFKARERKHDRHVVIKALQPGLAAAIGPDRFAAEVQIAARLGHPHILALLDSGEADGLLYYVMPYVGGETLRALLERDGALPIAATITILRDIADALAHAHAAGIVHRDLKPENVLLVGGHAFLLDFGVAKLDRVEGSRRETDPGLAIGTPGYMAPEQAAGQPVDHRADINVWGLLGRELLTGRRDPGAKVAERADAPRPLVALVEAALAQDPEARPASAAVLVGALDALVAPVRHQRRWPWLAAAGVAAAALAGWWFLGRSGGPIPVDELPQPIAVAPLSDETGDSTLAGIGRLAGDWLTQGLHEAGGMPVVAWPASRAAVEATKGLDVATVLRDATGARSAVVGSVYLIGDTLRFQVELVDTRSGIVLAAPPPVTVARDSAAAGVRELRDRVMGALAIRRDERLASAAAFASSPPTYAAYRVFDQALTDYEGYRYEPSLAGMLEAWRLDTTFTAALLYAGYAAWNGGQRRLADSLVTAVLARRQALSAFHVARAEQLRASLAGDTPGAVDASERAVQLAPGSQARYALAQSLESLNRPAAALAQLDSLDPDRGPMRGWPAYWSLRSYAEHQLGRHEAEIADAGNMERRHPTQRVPGVIVARAFASLGRTDALDSVLSAYDGLPPDVYWSQGAMRVVAGEELTAHGRPVEGRRYFVDAERWLRQRLRVVPDSRPHRYWLASALVGQHHWADAAHLFDGLRRQDPDRLLYRGMSAVLAAHAGDSAAASGYLATHDPADLGSWLVYRARVAAVLGHRDEALTLLGQAIHTGVDGWHWIHGTAFSDFEPLLIDPRYRALVATDGPE